VAGKGVSAVLFSKRLVNFRLQVHYASDEGDSWCKGKAWYLFRAGARVTFFGAKKVTKEDTQVQFKTAN
jgi:hypothetical protein